MALVVAAGRGTRLGGPLPKQYLPLAGQPLLRYSLETLARHPAISGVRVVFNPADRSLMGVRQQNGIASFVRVPYPYNEWHRLYVFPDNEQAFDLDLSPDGSLASVS